MSLAMQRTVNAWLRTRQRAWAAWIGADAQRLRPRDLSIDAAEGYIERYRAVAGDLATARRLLPGSATTAGLESLYAAAHVAIDGSARQTWRGLRTLFTERIPDTMRTLRPAITWIALLFVLSAGAGYWLIARYPELIGLAASDTMIDKVEHGQLWTEGLFNIAPSSVLSVRILSNNIAVSLFAFCTGVLFGLGAFYITTINGLMLGALFAYTHQHGLDGELLKFILAHGPVEISVMCIAAAAGTELGQSLIRPETGLRVESFRRATHRIFPALVACAVLLIVCGCIEGFVSPDASIPLGVRAMIGLGYFALMLAWLGGSLHSTAPAKLQVGVEHRSI
ncbi:MAG TPA: stage II sporulation protein M [Steroidobacteraceae bacterium]